MPWFPITDLSREDDIRMRRRRALMLLACIVFVPWIAFGGHKSSGSSAERTMRMSAPDSTRIKAMVEDALDRGAAGSLPRPAADAPRRTIVAHTLRIDLPCASSVTVLADPAYNGQAVVYAAPDDKGVLDTLTLTDGAISQASSCGDDAELIVRTGNATPLTLVQSGSNDIHAGTFDAPVTIESTGSGTVEIDHAGPLTVRQHASGDVVVGTITGPVTATVLGSGDFTVHNGETPVLDATSQGSGDVSLSKVRVGTGRVLLNGSGDFSAAEVGGSFEAVTNASGDVTIDAMSGSNHLRLRGEGSGDIIVRRGRIGSLDAVRHGSGDLTIGATIDSGRLDHSGDGDVQVPHAPGLIRTGD